MDQMFTFEVFMATTYPSSRKWVSIVYTFFLHVRIFLRCNFSHINTITIRPAPWFYFSGLPWLIMPSGASLSHCACCQWRFYISISLWNTVANFTEMIVPFVHSTWVPLSTPNCFYTQICLISKHLIVDEVGL